MKKINNNKDLLKELKKGRKKLLKDLRDHGGIFYFIKLVTVRVLWISLMINSLTLVLSLVDISLPKTNVGIALYAIVVLVSHLIEETSIIKSFFSGQFFIKLSNIMLVKAILLVTVFHLAVMFFVDLINYEKTKQAKT